MRFCTTCGSELADGQQFCPSCGTPRPSAPVTTQPPVPPPAEQPPMGYQPPTPPPPTAPGAWTAAVGPRVPDERRRRNRGAVAAAVVLSLIALGSWGYVLLDRTGWLEDEPDRTVAADRDRDADEDEEQDPAEQPDEPEEPEETEQAPEEEVEPGSLAPASVTADCVAPPAKDSAGATVTYEPELVLDGEPSTAWRCPGSAVGRRLVFTFDQPVTLLEVGLVPGYDKVDPADGIDRFTENRTVTGVTWRTDDGGSFAQSIPNPERVMTMLELPEPVTTRTLTLEITSTGNDGARRDFTPISDVELYGY